MTVLRDVTAADLPSVRQLIGQLGYAPDDAEFRARFERVLAADGHRIVVAEEAGAVVGVLHVFERPALDKGCEAVVQALVVDGAVRSHGVGEALMREAEAWATRRGLDATSLHTRTDRDRARVFYERIGYRLKATSHLMAKPSRGTTWTWDLPANMRWSPARPPASASPSPVAWRPRAPASSSLAARRPRSMRP